MKTALITSTIHVPEVLRLYRACSADVAFFVALEKEKSTAQQETFLRDIPGCSYFWSGTSKEWACSELISWNTVERRNIALLEALKWGADIVVTVDDDNIPMSTDYFDRHEQALTHPFSGPKVSGYSGWFDPGALLIPPAQQRGFPFDQPALWRVDSTVNAKVGVAAGAILGDPDLDAITRMVNRHAPINVQTVSELLRAGIVVDPGTWTITNSQNTAFLRDLAPAFLTCPQLGRFADIFASLIAQRVMRETGHVVHHGQPLVYQQRHPHDTFADFRAEILGMQHVSEFTRWLMHVELDAGRARARSRNTSGCDAVEHVRTIYGQMKELPWMPPGVAELGLAWVQDCERVLS